MRKVSELRWGRLRLYAQVQAIPRSIPAYNPSTYGPLEGAPFEDPTRIPEYFGLGFSLVVFNTPLLSGAVPAVSNVLSLLTGPAGPGCLPFHNLVRRRNCPEFPQEPRLVHAVVRCLAAELSVNGWARLSDNVGASTADIARINEHLRARLLADRKDRPGQPLRKLLRGGLIVGAEQRPRRPYGRWRIHRAG